MSKTTLFLLIAFFLFNLIGSIQMARACSGADYVYGSHCYDHMMDDLTEEIDSWTNPGITSGTIWD